MFGTNKTERRLSHHDGLSLDVVDVFSTIQGEGPHAGMPATFVRLAGCHLRCHFCDTDFTTDRHERNISSLVDQIWEFGNTLVVLTGGEPLRQNVIPLCSLLLLHKHTIQVETAGHFWWPELEHVAQLVVSPKTPVVHPNVRQHAIAWKYIVNGSEPLDLGDGLPVTSTQPEGDHGPVRQVLARPPPEFPRDRIYIQPCDLQDPQFNAAAQKRCMEVCIHHGYRLSIQLHKILGLP